jgi:hypothetical protein
VVLIKRKIGLTGGNFTAGGEHRGMLFLVVAGKVVAVDEKTLRLGHRSGDGGFHLGQLGHVQKLVIVAQEIDPFCWIVCEEVLQE